MNIEVVLKSIEEKQDRILDLLESRLRKPRSRIKPEKSDNSAILFCNEALSFDYSFATIIGSRELYHIYLDWCKDRQLYAVNNVHFGRAITRQFPIVKKSRDIIDDKRVYCHVGLKLSDDANNI